MRAYEVMTIHRSDLGEDDVQSRISALETHISNSGATVQGRDLWGKRRFAYEIEHMTEGYYSVVSFDGEGESIDAVDRMLSLSDEVVRHKIVRKDG
jgi:small subunit ribosomal protein S6